MSRARAALGFVAMLSAFRTGWAEPCAPRAELGGDRAAVAQVRGELERLGVELDAPARGCRTVRAQVALDAEGGIAVAIVDGSRRSEGRVVGDASVAAAWIDSWLRDEIDGIGPVPALRERPRVGTAAVAPGLVPPTEPRERSSRSPRVLDRFAAGVAYETVFVGAGVRTTGIEVGGCVRIGRACVGLAGHYASEGVRQVKLTAMRRSDASVLATTAFTISIGRMSLAPELGVGVGRRTTARVELCTPQEPDGGCNPSDPSCVPPKPPVCEPSGDPGTGPLTSYVGDNLSVTTYTPRVSSALRLAVPLFEHVWLDGLAAMTLAPRGHAEPFGPGKTPTPIVLEDVRLPGEPATTYSLGVGLRIGAP